MNSSNNLTKAYLNIYKVIINASKGIMFSEQLNKIDDTIILNKLVRTTNSNYIIVTAISSDIAEYKARQLLWRG